MSRYGIRDTNKHGLGPGLMHGRPKATGAPPMGFQWSIPVPSHKPAPGGDRRLKGVQGTTMFCEEDA